MTRTPLAEFCMLLSTWFDQLATPRVPDRLRLDLLELTGLLLVSLQNDDAAEMEAILARGDALFAAWRQRVGGQA
jgi:antibiotic biosynthesis monooxygenase (ABM) superfamily enzyme